MFKERNIEIKLGIFVFLGLAILVAFVFFIGDFYIFQPGWNLKFIFHFVSGIKIASPVRLAGVDVGKVKDIRVFLDPQTKNARVEILAYIKKTAKVPRDSSAYIDALGLLGEKYIEIIPGDDFASLLKDGDSLIGEDPLSMQEIGVLVRNFASKIEEGIEGLNSFLKDEELKRNLKQTVECLSEATKSTQLILERVQSGQGTLGKLLYEDRLYEDLEEFAQDIKKHPWKLLHKPKGEE